MVLPYLQQAGQAPGQGGVPNPAGASQGAQGGLGGRPKSAAELRTQVGEDALAAANSPLAAANLKNYNTPGWISGIGNFFGSTLGGATQGLKNLLTTPNAASYGYPLYNPKPGETSSFLAGGGTVARTDKGTTAVAQPFTPVKYPKPKETAFTPYQPTGVGAYEPFKAERKNAIEIAYNMQQQSAALGMDVSDYKLSTQEKALLEYFGLYTPGGNQYGPPPGGGGGGGGGRGRGGGGRGGGGGGSNRSSFSGNAGYTGLVNWRL